MPRSFLRLLPERLAMLLMVIIFVVLLGQIIARFLGIPLNWGQEFTVNAFIWFVFLSIAAAYCRSEHMAVDFIYLMLEPRLGRKTRIVWRLGIEILQMAVMVVLAIGLLVMTLQSWPLRAGSMPEFRIGYLYLGAFFSVTISIVAQIGNAITLFKKTSSSLSRRQSDGC